MTENNEELILEESEIEKEPSVFLKFLNSDLYRKQLMWWIPLLTSALICVFALVMCTPLGNLINLAEVPYSAIKNADGSTRVMNQIMSDLKPYNDSILICGIVGLIISALYKLTRSNVRKRYYISNEIYSVVSIAYFTYAAISLLMLISEYKNLFFNYQDFDEINQYALAYAVENFSYNSTSANWIFILGYIISALLILIIIMEIVNFVYNTIGFVKRVSNEKNAKNESIEVNNDSSNEEVAAE